MEQVFTEWASKAGLGVKDDIIGYRLEPREHCEYTVRNKRKGDSDDIRIIHGYSMRIRNLFLFRAKEWNIP